MTRPPGSAELAIALSPFIARERKAALPWARLGEPDWHALQGFLANERLLPLVWSELQRHNAAVPAVFAEACKEARTRNTVQAAVRLRGLKRILDTAAEADVPVIAMRTPYLIERLYGGDCGLRHFLDVDLAVLPRDLAPFLSALRGQFGRLDAGRQTREDAVRKAVLGGRIECRCGGVPLDLHWQLTLLYNFQRSGRRARRQEAIWERSGTVEFSWGACRVLSDEDLLVHLAEHMVIQHDLGGRPYRNAVEFAHLFAEARPDLARLEAVAIERRSLTALRTAAWTAVQLLDVPPEARDFLRLAGAVGPMVRRRAAALLHVGGAPPQRETIRARIGDLLNSTRAMAAFMDGADARLALARSVFFPGREILSYAMDRTLTRPSYLAHLLLLPAVLAMMLPALSTCAIRQAGDMAGAIRRWLHDRIWTWMDLTFVVVYFGINLRDTGLLGRGAWRLWRERLLPGPNWRWRPGAPPVWLHVAGPGDARAAERLIHALRAIEPDLPLFITCGTVPARSYCEAHFPAAGVRTAWLPFDTPRGMRRALRRLDPRAFVCAQGEFWPNLVRELHRAGVPDVVLRVDMLDWDTQAEFPGWVRPWYEEMLSLVNRFSVRAPLFKERLLRSGVRDERIVVGHDYRVESLPPPDASRAAEFAGLFGATEDCPLVVLASPRVDEVRALAPLLAEPIRNQAFRFLVAPAAADIGRRAERVLRGAGFRVVRRSELAGPAPEGAVIMLDTHGELYAIFAAARAVVIGDTFPPAFSVGANVWEPLRQGAAIVYGPSFAPTGAMARLEGAGAARRVPSWERLPAALDDMLARPIERRAVCEATAAAIEDEPSASWLDADVVLALVREQAAARADAGRWRTGGLRPRAEVRSTVLDALSWAPEAD